QVKVRSKYFGETELKLSEVTSLNATAQATTDVTAPFANGDGLFKAAHLLERGDFFAAQQMAAAFGKGKEVHDLASLFLQRTKKGAGMGLTPGVFKPDGIEAFICQMDSTKPIEPQVLEKHAADVARAFYLTAMIGEAHRSHCPVREKQGKKDPKDWDR